MVIFVVFVVVDVLVVVEVFVVVVFVVVCVSSRHEMRHSAPVAAPFLSDTNLNILSSFKGLNENIFTSI